MAEPEAGDAESPRDRPADRDPEPGAAAQTTVGTGSVLGIGCLAAVALFVLLALIYRWIGGTW